MGFAFRFQRTFFDRIGLSDRLIIVKYVKILSTFLPVRIRFQHINKMLANPFSSGIYFAVLTGPRRDAPTSKKGVRDEVPKM